MAFHGLRGIQVTSEIAYSVPDERLTHTNNNMDMRISEGRSHSVTSNYSPGYSITIQGGRSLSDPGTFHEERSGSTSTSIPSTSHLVLIPTSGSGSRPGPTPLQPGPGSVHIERPETNSSRRRSSAGENTSRAAWAYTKYAMLFFIALLVTWVPSTLNRVYAFARPSEFSFGLNFASSFVLPLQGFWNSVIYVSISWPAFKSVWRDFRARGTGVEMVER